MEQNELLVKAIQMRVDFFDLIRSTSLEEYNRDNPIYPLKEQAYKMFKKLANEILKIKPEKRRYYVRFTKQSVIGKDYKYQDNCGFCVKSLDSYAIKRPFDSDRTIVENLLVKDLKTNKIIYQGNDYNEFLKEIPNE